MRPDHPHDEDIQRLLDGELTAVLEAPLRAHLARCDGCRDRVEETRRDRDEIETLLRLVDHPTPRVHAERVTARATSQRRLPWQRLAAGIVLSLGVAGAAAALPGSPFRTWVMDVAHGIALSVAPAPAVVMPAPPDPAAPNMAGVSLIPDGDIAIVFTSSQKAGTARVAFSFGPELTIQAPPGAARFASEEGRLVVDNAGSSASFDIQLPRSAQRVEIRVSGQRRFLKDGVRIVTSFPSDSSGAFLIPLTSLAR